MKTLIASDPWGAEEWGHVIELHELAPDAFSTEEWEEMPFAFLRSAESFLVDNADNLNAIDEIESMSVVAEQFAVELYPTWVQHAEEQLGQKLAAKDERDEMEFERWREEGRPRPADMSGEMDGLFDRLAQN